MTDRDGNCFLMRHMTVERNERGTWDAWYVHGDEQHRRIEFPGYRTMRAAQVVVERAAMAADREGRRA
jgi:hypothetical protein